MLAGMTTRTPERKKATPKGGLVAISKSSALAYHSNSIPVWLRWLRLARLGPSFRFPGAPRKFLNSVALSGNRTPNARPLNLALRHASHVLAYQTGIVRTPPVRSAHLCAATAQTDSTITQPSSARRCVQDTTIPASRPMPAALPGARLCRRADCRRRAPCPCWHAPGIAR